MPLTRRLLLPVAVLVLGALLANVSFAAPLTLLRAQYTVPTPPTAAATGATLTVAVQLQNTGDEPWTTAGANPVNLTYHWYDAAGAPVIWDGLRTPLPAAIGPGGVILVNANVRAPDTAGTYQLRFALVREGIAWFDPSQPFPVTVAGAVYTAGYQVAAAPPQVPAGQPLTLQVTLTNTGNQVWNSAGAQPVNVAYHWYDSSGANAVVWDGARTPLGADVAPNTTRTVSVTVTAPSAPGTYQLRIALVKEGVAWFPPSAPQTTTALAAFMATITAPPLPALIAGGEYTIAVPIRNAGAAAWPTTGANPVRVSYHWHDASGNTVIWDGVRTPLAADVAAGASVTVNLKIVAPPAAGTYTLTIDLVRDGVGWFASFGSTPLKTPASVEAARYAASYALGASIDVYWAESKVVPVVVTNTGNLPWTAAGANPVNLAYHIFDAAGRTVVWDGARTSIGTDMAPGQTRTLSLAFTAPASTGTYTLAIELVREGAGWFSGEGSPAARAQFAVTSGLNGGYTTTTTPGQVTIGASIELAVTVVNYGPRTWSAAGANPVSLSYHIIGAHSGTTYVWDGNRGKLPQDVPPFTTAVVPITVKVPAQTGDYILKWDLVLEGVAWFSSMNVQTKDEPVTVVPGVVFYGSGFGHGLGMSQYGAQGYATGAAGPPLTGEQIIQKYFPGTAFQFPDVSRPFVRVLLSQPSSQSRYRCGDNTYFAGSFGDVISDGGFTVLDETANNAKIGEAVGAQKWQFVAVAGTDIIRAYNNGGSSSVLVREIHTSGAQGFAVVPKDPAQPLRFVQKDTPTHAGIYRGNFRFTNLGGTLRVINAVTYDDYVRGVISYEMPKSWHPEALKAQALAARSYAYASYRGGAADYDVSDDQSSQCYGGTAAESPQTEAAVAATAGKLVTYNGVIVKTYFSSSDGGYTIDWGCFENNIKKINGVWQCTPDPNQPYLRAIADPADRLVASPANPRASWSVQFTGAEMRSKVLTCNGVDIGELQGVDVSNQSPPVVGHVVSVKIIGSLNTIEVSANQFLRNCLGLRSTMVRLSPF